MAHQTKIRIKIGTDGVVEEQVEGVKGNQCAIITSPIEMALGPVIKRENTIDYLRTEERLEKLEEEDWIGTCTTLNCAFEPSRLETLEDEDWR